MATVAEKIIQIEYELRNESGEFTDAELLAYFNKSYEVLYGVLVNRESELVRTGTGSFVTVAGTQSYDLTGVASPVTDLWLPDKVWVSENEPMDMCGETDLYDTINEEEAGNTGHRCEPTEYCLVGDTMWFKESPDAVYTINLKYFPSFTALSAASSNMPLSGIFDQSLSQSVIFIAKNRNETQISVEGQLMTVFEEAALNLTKRRRYKPKQFSVRMK